MKQSIDFALLGSRIKHKREVLNITQQKMADDLSISKYYISKIENGKVKVTLETLAEIAEYLQYDMSELLYDISPLIKNYGNMEVLDIYSKADSKQKKKIIEIAKIIIDK